MILDGKMIAAERLRVLKEKIRKARVKPKLIVILVGKDPASVMYVQMKSKRAAEVGIDSEVRRLSAETTEQELIKQIQILNNDPSVTGILVQLPLPGRSKARTDEILAVVDPEKDVDGLTGRGDFLPATVRGILIAIGEGLGQRVEGREMGKLLAGKVVGVIGQGRLVGKPLADYLEKQGAKVFRADEYTDKLTLKEQSLDADILVVATGVPELVTANMVKPGAIVVDCGSPKAEVDFEAVSKVAGAITPVPGGVGPLTVCSLLENTFEASRKT